MKDKYLKIADYCFKRFHRTSIYKHEMFWCDMMMAAYRKSK